MIKGIAVMLMIQVHLVELFAYQGYTLVAGGKIGLFLGGPPAAPVFMAVMGYFALLSGRNMLSMILRGFQLLVLGLTLNVALNAHALFLIFSGNLDLNPYQLVFGADILPLAGISLVIIAILRKFLSKSPLAFFILALLFTIPSFFNGIFNTTGIPSYLMAFFGGSYPWSYFPVFPWLAYPLLGCSFACLQQKGWFNPFFVRFRLMIFTICMLILCGTSIWAIPHIISLRDYYHHNTLLFLWITVFLTAWIWLLSHLDRFAGNAAPLRFFRWMGKNVTAFYVIQWIIIGNIATAIYRSQNEVQLLFWFLGIMALCSLIVYIRSHWLNRRNEHRVL